MAKPSPSGPPDGTRTETERDADKLERIADGLSKDGYPVTYKVLREIAASLRTYDPANEPMALNTLHNILDCWRCGDGALDDFMRTHHRTIADLVSDPPPRPEVSE